MLTQFPSGTSLPVYYGYDLLGRVLMASNSSPAGPGVAYVYDALSRVTSMTQNSRTLSYAYDAAGNRTTITWPDTSNPLTATYVYDPLNHVTQIEQNGATSGPGLLATYAYDSLGRRTGISRAGGAGMSTSYAYDTVSRLGTLTQTLASSAGTTFTLGYNPANQVISRADSNGAFTAAPSAISLTYTANGLNQYSSITGGTQALAGAPQASLAYDPEGRIQSVTTSGTTSNFLYDGDFLAEEYNTSGTTTARYVPGPGTDEPLAVYSGASLSYPNWYAADQEGSIIATANSSGTKVASFAYGPYGEPLTSAGAPAWAGARYRYTGQIVIAGAQTYFYKARMYDPETGRFIQTDPAGFGGGINIYAYAMNDPINGWDPSGLRVYSVPLPFGGTRVCDDSGPNSDEGSGDAGLGDCIDYYPEYTENAFYSGPLSFGANDGKPQKTQHCSAGPAREFGISYSGNVFGILGGASVSITLGVSVPTSGAGIQGFVGGEFDPMVGLGVNAGTAVGPTWGHSPTSMASGFSANEVGSHVEGGAGLAYGASIGQTVLPDGTVSTSVGLAGPPLPALKAGAYFGGGPAYSGQVATPQLGCHG